MELGISSAAVLPFASKIGSDFGSRYEWACSLASWPELCVQLNKSVVCHMLPTSWHPGHGGVSTRIWPRADSQGIHTESGETGVKIEYVAVKSIQDER